MAILTVSRQIASLGDELCKSIADKLGYRFVGRHDIEKKIIELGFPSSKLKKFDEKKPGFFASLSKDRDEYLDYLQAAIYESAVDDNCVIIGRGSYIILKDLQDHISLKFIADRKLRIQRYKAEHNCSEKQAVKVINESDSNRDGFHQSFFSFDQNNPAMFHLVVNTGLLEMDSISNSIAILVSEAVTPEMSQKGNAQLKKLLTEQKIRNYLKYEEKITVEFLRVCLESSEIVLHGVSESKKDIQKINSLVSQKFPEYKIISNLSADGE